MSQSQNDSIAMGGAQRVVTAQGLLRKVLGVKSGATGTQGEKPLVHLRGQAE